MTIKRVSPDDVELGNYPKNETMKNSGYTIPAFLINENK